MFDGFYLPPKPAIVRPAKPALLRLDVPRFRVPVLAGAPAAAMLLASGGNGNDSFTKVLLHFDGTNGSTTITDSNVGGSAHTWTAHSATIDTSQSEFGGASLNVGAAVGWVDTPDSADFTLGSGDFTVDCWFNRQGGDGTTRLLVGHRDSGVTDIAWEMALGTANTVLGVVSANGTALTIVTGTTAITTTGWHHAELVRTGNILRMFLDGVQEGGDVAFTGAIHDSAGSLSVGRAGDLAQAIWNGFVDEFRLSVGIARHTSNFTPPTAAYS